MRSTTQGLKPASLQTFAARLKSCPDTKREGVMELELKSISMAGVAEANAKAEPSRLLNQPKEAESICLDVLAADPETQIALRNLGLAITDQFTGHASDRYAEVEAAFNRLTNKYEHLYYTGILHERRAK